MTRRRTISLTDATDAKVERISEMAAASPSDVIEAAIGALYALDETIIVRTVSTTAAEKKVATVQGWRRLFWTMLAERLGARDYVYDARKPYGPVTFGRFTIIFLWPDQIGIEDGTLHVHAFELPTAGSRIAENALTARYLVEDSVSQAVDETVGWMKERSA